jgi:hypothetical protein
MCMCLFSFAWLYIYMDSMDMLFRGSRHHFYPAVSNFCSITKKGLFLFPRISFLLWQNGYFFSIFEIILTLVEVANF